MNIELMVLNYLDCDSGRYPSSLAFCAFAVFMRGLPALVVCLAGAVEAGRAPSGKKGRRGLPRANMIGILSLLSPFWAGVNPWGVFRVYFILLFFFWGIRFFFFFF